MHDDWTGQDDALAPPPREDPGSPAWLLGLAAVALVLAAAAFTDGANLTFNIIGYVLASLVAFTLVALFRRAETGRFIEAGIASARWIDIGAIVLLAAGLAIAVLHAYRIARHFG